MTRPAHKTEGVNRTKTVRVYPFVFIAIDEDLQWRADKLFKQSLDHVNHRVLGENDLNCIMRNKFSPEVLGEWIEGIPCHVRAEVAVDNGQFKEMVNSMLDDPNNGKEKEVYFYHSDHLGGASWITDADGKAVQHLQYLPYGEPYVNQRISGYNERFTFTGKERDEETGYGYFGARYMDYTLMTSFISVDRYASKYPFISPYAYCAWNPIMLTDPTGDTIFNAYEAYKDVSQEIQRLTEMKEQESGLFKLFKRWSINNKIRNLKKNNLKYQKVQGALDAFKETNPEEYNRLDQLSSYGKKVNIIVGADLDKTHSPNGAEGTTDISFLQDKNTGDILGVSLFRITLYRSAFFPPSNGLAALANEMGDVIFATVKPQDAYLGLYGVKYEYKSYWKNASSQFSFAYEYYILNPNKHPKPNPYEY